MTTFDKNFSDDEYRRRIAKTRTAMDAAGLEAIVVCDPSNMSWLTGYDGWSFYVYQGVVLTQSGDPVWWGRAMDAVGAGRTVFMDGADHIRGYDDTYVQNPDKHPMSDLAGLLNELGLSNARIGVEMDNYYYSAKAHMTLTGALPEARFADATGLVNWQRAVKSQTEIEYMRRAARIVEVMHERVLELAEPGLRKNDLIAEIYATAIRGAEGHWGDYPAIVPMAPSGLDATAPHLTWDDRPMQKGEATFFEIAGAHRRYQCPQSRTLFLGDVPQKYRDAESAVLDAIEAGLEQAKPGNQAQDIANAFNATLNKAGFEKDSRCGYAIGISYPPDWGERTISFRRGDTTVLEPGMTFHFMPALWLDDGGLEITEPILITETGHECLCNTPRELWVKR
ncbi:ectoine hydrolase DoeA [Sulfitobacter mediterraneus]|uniref:ectoine hydrolase DoeA n=1 Tax=Sulfitobacter mediterraneus TaxID=83219 RepID=UPI0019338A05|nr:ectoine hydrolase DoeA [Sulfitobacter mediterraneus]MBM1631671.1 ectoine hydrolase DoeA [Sulfitobacter mediterraneus]MBM1639486.1 ectoine hydrolase DoeA [Sulfitobacter mediterraneus]MBM1643535.1 ectoine hydrolase DoeA [Sulfitobacter mediterraneus]MBM1647581.1 ectoine hydrolase DoeA [Sulfitobacter mediterraneus]MBM1651626.1 ectoine hydrolase DoeA [Sulfitobacter mediterraneus]